MRCDQRVHMPGEQRKGKGGKKGGGRGGDKGGRGDGKGRGKGDGGRGFSLPDLRITWLLVLVRMPPRSLLCVAGKGK